MLTPKELKYYKDEQVESNLTNHAQSTSKPKGTIDLSSHPDKLSVDVPQHGGEEDTLFILFNQQTKKHYLLKAQTKEEFKSWTQILSQTIADNITNVTYQYFLNDKNEVKS